MKVILVGITYFARADVRMYAYNSHSSVPCGRFLQLSECQVCNNDMPLIFTLIKIKIKKILYNCILHRSSILIPSNEKKTKNVTVVFSVQECFNNNAIWFILFTIASTKYESVVSFYNIFRVVCIRYFRQHQKRWNWKYTRVSVLNTVANLRIRLYANTSTSRLLFFLVAKLNFHRLMEHRCRIEYPGSSNVSYFVTHVLLLNPLYV